MTERMDRAVSEIAGIDRERMRALLIFVDHWGLDAYTPPSAVMEDVRSIVRLMLAEAHVARKSGPDNVPMRGAAPINAAPDDPRLVRARELLQPFVGLEDGHFVILSAYRGAVAEIMRALIDALEVHPASPDTPTDRSNKP